MKVFRPTLLILLVTSPAYAGMPSYEFSDVARLRIEDLSFFLVVLLLCAGGVKLLWNLLARDFPRLPKLGYGRALALTTLLGIFTLLVLSMISGARELLTPGAWRKQGSTYRLTDPANEPLRRKGLETLRAALWSYAKAHDGQFPVQDFSPDIPDDFWKAPDEGGSRYVYRGGLRTDTPATLLAAEPEVFGGKRLTLLTSGEITPLTTEEIRARLAGGATGAR